MSNTNNSNENDKILSFSDIKSNSQNSLENLSKLQEEHKKKELDLEFAQFNEDIKQILKGNKPSLCRIESKHSRRTISSKSNKNDFMTQNKNYYNDYSAQYAISENDKSSNYANSSNHFNEINSHNSSSVISKKNENEKTQKKESIRDIMLKRIKKEELENEQILNMFAKKNNEYVKNCFIKKKEMEKMSLKLGKADVQYNLNLCNELPFFQVDPEKKEKKDFNKNKKTSYKDDKTNPIDVRLKEIDIQWRNLDKQIKREEKHKERQKLLQIEKNEKLVNSNNKSNISKYINNNDNNRDKKKEEHKKEITENLERCSHLKEHLYKQLLKLNKKIKIPESDVIQALKSVDFPFKGEQFAELFETEQKDSTKTNCTNNEKDDLSDYN